jgi:hypothetical protein
MAREPQPFIMSGRLPAQQYSERFTISYLQTSINKADLDVFYSELHERHHIFVKRLDTHEEKDNA